MFDPGNMKGYIQEWFADASDIKEVCDIYITIVAEAEKQYGFMLDERIKEIKTN